VDRAVPHVPPRRLAPHRQQHLDEPAVGAEPVDLGGRRLRVKARHHDAAAQPLVAVEELIPHPVVDRRGQGRLEVRVTAALEGDDAAEDRGARLGGLEELSAQLGVAVRREAARRPGLRAR
jgi:hypothetical protein